MAMVPVTNVGVRIVDLSIPGNPELVGRIPLRARGKFEGHSHGDAVATLLTTAAFAGDIAIVLDGVPDSFTPADYPQPYGLWDVERHEALLYRAVMKEHRHSARRSGLMKLRAA